MIDNDTVYGLEFYSQDHMMPGFILTLTGEEIKKLITLLGKKLNKDTVKTFSNSKI